MIKRWLRRLIEKFDWLLSMDMRVFDDSAWLLGSTPKSETVELLEREK